MKESLRLAFLVILILMGDSYCGYSQDSYSRYVDSARYLSKSNQYLKAGQFYSKAFASNNGRGLVSDRYNAARVWSLASLPDSAFFQLNRIARAGYYKDLDKLNVDTAFASLRTDSRWAKLIAVVKQHGVNLSTTLVGELNPILVAILDTMRIDDQSYRNTQLLVTQTYGYKSPEATKQTRLMLHNDSLNQQKLVRIFSQYGWPSTETIGTVGNQTIFLVLQHSDLTMRLKYLDLVNDAFKKGQITPSEMALFTDRTDLMQGKRQTYGTQIIADSKTGISYIQPMTDPEHVDERRSSIGLPPIKQYVIQWNIDWSIDQYYEDLPKVQALTHIY